MKKIIALLLVAAAAFMLFSCGNTTPAKQTTAVTQSTSDTASIFNITSADVSHPSIKLEPYANIDFINGTMIEENSVLTLEYKNMEGASPAAVEDTEVTLLGKTKTLPALRIKNTGAYVKATFNEFANAEDFDNFVNENGGLTIEVLYLDNSSLNTVRGIVCCTESLENGKASTRSGWGIAEDNGKPYFIAGNSDSNTYVSVYAQSEASQKELVHIVAIFDSAHEQISLYVNGALHSSKKTAGRFTSANKEEYFEKFNMANIFYIGSDPTAQKRPEGDFPADDLTVADVKIYAKALSKNEALLAYSLAVMMFD